jgi:ABC-2 type transport system ATP-binding protein
MDEAERCTEVGFIDRGKLLAKATPRALEESFKARILEVDVDQLMAALVRLRQEPEVLGVSLRSGSLRIYSAEPERLVKRWEEHWPFPEFQWKAHRWVEPDMEDVFTAYSQRFHSVLKPLDS